MRKGAQVLYNNQVYEVWRKEKNSIWIYNPGSQYPELTMLVIGVSQVKPVRRAKT